MATRHRRNCRFERPELDICWAAWETLDDALKHELLRAEATDLAVPPGAPITAADKVRAAIGSLRDAADLLGHSPSLIEYRRLHAEWPELRLVADGTLRRWLGCGSWNECLERSLLETVSDGDFVSPPQGDAFKEQGLVAAVELYRNQHDGEVPSLQKLLAWARQPRIRALPGQRPLSCHPFSRFGGYRAVLERNGLIDADGLRVSASGYRIPLVYAYSDVELCEHVKQVAQRLGHTPRGSEYERERLKMMAEAAEPCTYATASTLTDRFGPWPNVVAAAGLPPATRSDRRKVARRPRGVRYSNEEKREWVRTAWVELGEPFTAEAYTRWRRSRLEQANARGEFLEIPSICTIWSTYGKWRAACAQILPGVRGDSSEPH